MKKLTDYMAEELSAAFEKAGYDSSYGKVGVSNRPQPLRIPVQWCHGGS